ncbi:hypothetical protein BDD12DRAFT_879624 [Trichophaea hybrida]|nr:hypothetical protein BDD12DRAFT_879624 [Trichophaea hybrida]
MNVAIPFHAKTIRNELAAESVAPPTEDLGKPAHVSGTYIFNLTSIAPLPPLPPQSKHTTTMTSLRILVPIKRVLDYAIKPRIAASGKTVDLTGQKMSLNPFDELSIEASVRLREAHPSRVSDILAFSAGPAKSQDALRTAMAIGADRGLLVDTANTDLEPLAVAKILKKVVEKENMLAGLLGWGQATQAAEIKLQEDSVKVVKEVDGGTETVQGKLPMVVTTDLRLNEPRYASLPNIMKAKKKKLDKETLESYGAGLEGRLEVLKVSEPPPRQGGGKVADVGGLVEKLKELGAI